MAFGHQKLELFLARVATGQCEKLGTQRMTCVICRYTYMDEEYLDCLQTHMKWERDNGIIHLMPIAVVYQEDMY